jgi:hypothetical protein
MPRARPGRATVCCSSADRRPGRPSNLHPPTPRRRRAFAGAAVVAIALGVGCSSPDPKQELEVTGVETYWAFDSSSGATQYMAPVVRFGIKNKAPKPVGAIQATAVFKRQGEEGQTWGSDWRQVAPSGKPLAPGESTLVVLKSDARYYSTGTADDMFGHKLFRDAVVEVFVRVGSSGWVEMAKTGVERRIGSRTVEGQ